MLNTISNGMDNILESKLNDNDKISALGQYAVTLFQKIDAEKRRGATHVDISIPLDILIIPMAMILLIQGKNLTDNPEYKRLSDLLKAI